MLDKKKCDQLVKQAKILGEAPMLANVEILDLENQLKVILPDDFKYISNFYDYEYISFFDFYSFPIGVINQTKYYRDHHNLENNYLVLFWDDVSFVLFKTKSSQESEVVWCNHPDFFNLCEGKPMEYKPTIFPSFTDFFEYLLEEEEKLQAED